MTLCAATPKLPEESINRWKNKNYLRPTSDAVTESALQTMQVTINGRMQDFPHGTTVAALLEQLGLQPRYVAVERNLQLVPRQEHAACVLEHGDQLEIVTLVGGG